MSRRIQLLVLSTSFVIVTASTAAAQQQSAAPPPPEPAKAWSQTTSAGLALTSGNKDTSTLNAGFEIVYDPQRKNVVKADGLLLRGKTAGDLTADRLGLNGRDEFKISDGVFVFGQLQYLRDQFKDIAYLFAPTTGIGYRLTGTASTQASIDAGLGSVWEKARATGDVRTSAVINLTEKLSHKISQSATLTQTLAALHRVDDFADALYTLNVALASSVTTHTQLKVELLDTYKNRVPAGVQKNDVAVIVGMVFKR